MGYPVNRVFLLLGLAMLAGCSSAPRPALAPPATAAIDTAAVLAPLVRSLAARAAAVRTLRGRAEIEIRAEAWEGSSETEAIVLAQKPDQLHLRAYAGPVTALDLVTAQGRFWAHVPRRHELWTGPVRALERRTGVPVLGEDLVNALLGDPFGAPENARLVSVGADRAVLVWSARSGGEAVATIRRLDGVPLSFEWRKDGASVATIRYDDYVRETEGLWPRKLLFHWSDPDASLRLTFHELQLNRDLPGTSFAPPDPPDAKRIEFSAAEGER